MGDPQGCAHLRQNESNPWGMMSHCNAKFHQRGRRWKKPWSKAARHLQGLQWPLRSLLAASCCTQLQKSELPTTPLSCISPWDLEAAMVVEAAFICIPGAVVSPTQIWNLGSQSGSCYQAIKLLLQSLASQLVSVCEALLVRTVLPLRFPFQLWLYYQGAG